MLRKPLSPSLLDDAEEDTEDDGDDALVCEWACVCGYWGWTCAYDAAWGCVVVRVTEGGWVVIGVGRWGGWWVGRRQ